MAIENYYYISVSIRLGSCFIDSRANETKDPVWTITDVNDKSKSNTSKQNRFRIFKNGIHFVFNRGAGN
jgi:hypothetical protein